MPDTTPPNLDATIVKSLRAQVDAAKDATKKRVSTWKRNVELRVGKAIDSVSVGVTTAEDDTQSEINPDWSLTKTKTANLYSQTPEVALTHENMVYGPAVPLFAKGMNYELSEKRANVGAALEEVLNDVVNAAGFGVAVVEYAARFEDVEVPSIDVSRFPPEMVPQLIATKQIPTTTVPRVVSDKFSITRISPADFLWPATFAGSCFDAADWVGRRGAMSTAEATNEFKLSPEQLDAAEKAVNERDGRSLRDSEDEAKTLVDPGAIQFTDLYYWRYRFDAQEKHFCAIWRLVLIDGIDKPVYHGPWKGQRLAQDKRAYVGAVKFPIQVCTITYISDTPIPPSDSSAGRPQVIDLRRSRAQMFANREHSRPLRWFDVNRVDPMVRDLLMRGVIQGIIPTNGDGSRTIGEIARASYPSEDLAFDAAAKNDLMESWQIGPNQLGAMSGGRRTKAEANIVQANFATRIGQERERVTQFFLRICDVLAGLMVLYSDFPTLTDQERQTMQQAWDGGTILHHAVFKIRPDSTIMLDVGSRIDRRMRFLNMTVKSGFVDPMPIILELAELSGIDPTHVIRRPEPPPPEDPNISFRFAGKEDLMNPLIVAMLMKAGKMPTPEELDAAKRMLLANQQPPAPPPPAAPQAGASAPGMAPAPSPPGAGGLPAEAHPQWSLASKVAARQEDME